MADLLLFLVAVPISVELLGGCMSIRDNWADTETRAAAVERLSIPVLCWGALWWIAGSNAGGVLAAALAFVAVWQAVMFYGAAALLKLPRFHTIAIATDDAAGPERKSPGDNGDWGGERSSPGHTTIDVASNAEISGPSATKSSHTPD